MKFLLSLGALTKLDAPVNAPEFQRLLITIIDDGCMRCIKSLSNISISLHVHVDEAVMRAFDALNAPDASISRFLGKLMHPPCTQRYQSIHIDAPIIYRRRILRSGA